jgi:hypothetical protein
LLPSGIDPDLKLESWRHWKPKRLFGVFGESGQAPKVKLLFVGAFTDIDVGVTKTKGTEDETSELTGGGEDGDGF